MRLWRISDHAGLDGGGGLVAPGRWHRVGRPIVYLADTSSLALLETFVRINRTRLPPPYQLIEVDVPNDLPVTHWPDGRDLPDRELTRDWGDAFLDGGDAPLARVPSRVAPHAWNHIFNPRHPAADRVGVAGTRRWPWDARLFGSGPTR